VELLSAYDRICKRLQGLERIFNLPGETALAGECLVWFLPLNRRWWKLIWQRVSLPALKS
jgi:hypothetical protein